MTVQAKWTQVVVLAWVAGSAGCITGDGAEIEVRVFVTHDLGHDVRIDQEVVVPQGATALDVLMEVADVELRFGGGFVHAVNGAASDGATQTDWFYEVDGVQASKGAADWHLIGGERIHWDYRSWQVPGSPPGLWNSFPWQDAGHYWDPTLDAADAAPLNHDWPSRWQEDSMVAHVSPERAPWHDLPGVQLDGDAVVVDQKTIAPPWAMAMRVGPPGSAHAVIVHNGFMPDPPTDGWAWVLTPQANIEVPP